MGIGVVYYFSYRFLTFYCIFCDLLSEEFFCSFKLIN